MKINFSDAHKHSSFHKEEILNSKICGCFCCKNIYSPSEITEWIDKGKTALCPKCGIDSVIGSNSGININEKFLSQMNEIWFL